MFRKESDVMDTNDFDGLEEGEEEEDEEEELIESSDSEDEEEMARRKGQEGLQKYMEVRKYALNGLFLIDDTKDADATNTHGKTQAAKAPANN